MSFLHHGFRKRFCFVLFFAFILTIFSCKTPSIIATRAIQEGDEMNNQQDYNQAIVHYEKYIEVAPSLGLYRNYSMEADVFRKLSHCYSTQAKYQTSLKYLDSALKIDSTIPANKLEVIEDYRRIGILYGIIGDFKKSRENLNTSLGMNKGMENSLKDVKKLSFADTYLSIAQLNFTTGEYANVESYISSAISIYEKVQGEYTGLVEGWLLLGKYKIETLKVDEGVKLVKKSMKLAEEHDMNTARHLQTLSRAMILLTKYEDALKYALEALKKAEETNIISQILWMNIKVGDVYNKIGNDQKADEYYKKATEIRSYYNDETSAILPSIKMRLGDVKGAYDIYQKSGSEIGIGFASLKLGFLKSKENNSEEALVYYRKAASIFKEKGIEEGIIVSETCIAKELINTDSLDLAEEILNTLGNTSSTPENEWKKHFEYGRLYEKRGDPDAAFNAYKKSVKVIEEIRGNLNIEEFKSDYTDNKQNVYESIIMLLLNNQDHDCFKTLENSPETEAFYYAERAKARVFLDILGNAEIKPKETEDSVLLQKEYSARMKIQSMSKELQKADLGFYEKNTIEENLKQYRKYYNEILQRIKLTDDSYRSLISVEPSTIEDIRKELSDKKVLLEYWIGDEQLAIWLISKHSFKSILTDIGKDELTALTEDCRKKISPYGTSESTKSLKKLYEYLIKPVEKDIKAYSSLVFIPHQSLHFIPFHALKGANNKFLIEDYAVSYVPSASVLTMCKSPKKTGNESFLGMALGDLYLGDYPGLPGTEHEIHQITNLFKDPTVTVSENTTETFIKNNGKNFNILHVATHGILNRELPMYSYLLMSPDDDNDGMLTVNEIYDFDLNCNLVTLSACETALGELSQGDELTGLSRAFIYAGSPAVIVSLWPVDDVSTAFIMTKLYQYYSSGYPLDESLKIAQKSLFDKQLTFSNIRGLTPVQWDEEIKSKIESGSEEMKNNPYFWAPFILIGNTGN